MAFRADTTLSTQGGDSYKTGLSRIKNFLEVLGNPEINLKSIHIGGTNGKGSTSHIISSILQESNKKLDYLLSSYVWL